jgi:dipeptidyl aminopeptidase/acylaminoacyl peptidase
MDSSKTSLPPQIPVRDFFRNPEIAGYSLSPDGKWIAFVQPFERRMNIHVESREAVLAGTAKPRRLTSEKDRDIRQYFWKGSDTILYLKDFGGDENFHLFAADRSGENTRDLTPFLGARVEVVDSLVEDEAHILVTINDRNPESPDVYRLTVATGEREMIAQNPGNITVWLTDHEGQLRVAVASDGVNQTVLFREKESDPFSEMITTNFREQLLPLLFTFDNKNIYAASNLGRDKQAIVIYDPRKKKELEMIFEHPEVDVDGLEYSRYRKVLTEIGFITWRRERKVLDARWKELYASLEEKLPGQETIVTSYDRMEELFTVRAISDRSLGAYYLYDLPNATLIKLSDVSPWLPEADLVTMQPIKYTSRDGLTIHGYLSLPKGRDPKNLPVVVNPHGGPWHRDVWGYNPEVQLFANRGYAVLQVNFRGSTGYGRKFWEASFKQWGKTMQDDVTDGVKWLIAQGIADPERVAIYGGSYGGYSTLAGVTFTPDLYACGIDYVGVSNLFTFMNSIPPYWKPFLESMYEMVGHPERDKELLMSASPVFHTDKITAPLMVIQGAKDPRVNIDEADQIVNALKARNIDVPYIVKENEGHGFSNEENRFEAYEAMEKFLAKHIGS